MYFWMFQTITSFVVISNQIKRDIYNLICFWTFIINEDCAKLPLQKMYVTERNHFEEPTFYFSGQKSRRMEKMTTLN